MLSRWRGRGRGTAIVVAAGLAAVALAVVVAAVATARPLGSRHESCNLSETATLISAYPDLAVSSDGDRVVTIWTEELRSGAGSARGHVYLRAASETGAGWGSKIPVFTGTDDACAYVAAVGVTGTTVHVAYVVYANTCLYPGYMQVRYRTCSLVSGQCDGSEATVAAVSTSLNRITWVDLALDTEGNPHVVWAQGDKDGKNGDIYYRAYDGTNWSEPYPVATGGDNSMPAIAWADGYVHVAWVMWDGVGHEEAEKDKCVLYRRRSASGWETYVNVFSPIKRNVGGKDYYLPPGRPEVAAGSGKVFIVWDCCSNSGAPDPSSYCSTYHLVYRRSNDNGAHWPQSVTEVGTSYLYPASFDQLEDYVSEDPEGVQYLRRLRPSIALNKDGWPAVVWHAEHGEGGGEEGEGGGKSHPIYYSYALSGTDTAVGWITTTVLSEDQQGGLGSAVVGTGTPGSEQYLHAAYMRKPGEDSQDAWDVYYEGFSYNPHADIRVASGLVLVGSTVTLDGSGSYDPQGSPLTYDWSLTGRPAGSGAALSNSSAVSPTLTVDEVGHYTVTLKVDNGLMASPLETQIILACDTIYSVYLPLVMRGGP